MSGSGSCWLPLLWQYLHLTLVSRANALCTYTILVAQDDVDDAPFIRGHRLEGDDVTRLADLLRDLAGQVDKHLLAPSAIALDVDTERRRLVATLGDDGVDHVLQCGERLAAAPDEDAEFIGRVIVGPVDVEDVFDQPRTVARCLRLARRDLRVEVSQQGEQVTERGPGEVKVVGRIVDRCVWELLGRARDGNCILVGDTDDRLRRAFSALRTLRAVACRSSVAGPSVVGPIVAGAVPTLTTTAATARAAASLATTTATVSVVAAVITVCVAASACGSGGAIRVRCRGLVFRSVIISAGRCSVCLLAGAITSTAASAPAPTSTPSSISSDPTARISRSSNTASASSAAR